MGQALCRDGNGTSAAVCLCPQVWCLCVNTPSVFTSSLSCTSAHPHVIWPANLNLISASCTYLPPLGPVSLSFLELS